MTKSDFIKLACKIITADCQPKSISYSAKLFPRDERVPDEFHLKGIGNSAAIVWQKDAPCHFHAYGHDGKPLKPGDEGYGFLHKHAREIGFAVGEPEPRKWCLLKTGDRDAHTGEVPRPPRVGLPFEFYFPFDGSSIVTSPVVAIEPLTGGALRLTTKSGSIYTLEPKND